MKNENTENINNDESEIYAFIVVLLVILFPFEHDMAWNDLEHELLYNNRFVPNTDVINKVIEPLKNNCKRATKIIRKGKKLFRARNFERNFADYLSEILEFTDYTQAEKDEIMSEFKNPNLKIPKTDEFFGYLFAGALLKNEYQTKKYLKYLRDKKFKGYDSNASTAPPPDFITEGRANPSHIRYLYMATKLETAIYEVKPILGQEISVATMEVKEDLKILDLSIYVKEKTKNKELDKRSMFNVIGNAFSIPNHRSKEGYISTQFISEYIKNFEHQKYDGIKFPSSLHKGGINVLIFNPDKCKPIDSSLYDIENISISFEKQKQ